MTDIPVDSKKYVEKFWRHNPLTNITQVPSSWWGNAPSDPDATICFSSIDDNWTIRCYPNGQLPKPIVTYKFPSSYSSKGSERTDIGFGQRQQEITKEILDGVSSRHNITFQQVSDDQKAHIEFVHFRFEDIAKNFRAGFANYPSNNGGVSALAYGLLGASERDSIHLIFNPLSDPGPVAAYASTVGRNILAHEIGHSLGLRHTHPEFEGGASQLSYHFKPGAFGGDLLGPVDHANLDWAYGSLVPFTEMRFSKNGTQSFIPESVNKGAWDANDVMAIGNAAVGAFNPAIAALTPGIVLVPVVGRILGKAKRAAGQLGKKLFDTSEHCNLPTCSLSKISENECIKTTSEKVKKLVTTINDSTTAAVCSNRVFLKIVI